MKKITITIAALALFALANQTQAQTAVKKEISKTVNVEEESGIKVITINTTENGKTKTEVLKGADADAKIAELEKEQSGTTKSMVVGPDGQKHLKVEQKVIKREKIDK